MDPVYSDPDGTKGNRFRAPFKIYENFRNVYKGVRRNSGTKGSYAFDGGGGGSGRGEAAAEVPEEISGDGAVADCSIETASSASSSAAADEAPKKANSDGNSTDDSGIDSFSDNNASPEPNPDASGAASGKKRNVWKRELVINDGGGGEGARGGNGGVELKSVKSKVKETVLALESKYSDIEPIYSKVNKMGKGKGGGGGATSGKSKELKELSKMLNDTDDLLSRNSNLRASLTITMKKKNRFGGGTTKTTTTIVLPTPKLDRKKQMLVEFNEPEEEVPRENEEKPALSVKEDGAEPAVRSSDNKAENNDGNKSPFIRHNPTRKPTARRSMRLAPKTVMALATRFDGLLDQQEKPEAASSEETKSKKDPQPKPSGGKVAATKDISSIISALNKLDEEASKDTAVLRRSLRRAALQKARAEKKKAKQAEGLEPPDQVPDRQEDRADGKEENRPATPPKDDTIAMTDIKLGVPGTSAEEEEEEEDYYERVEHPDAVYEAINDVYAGVNKAADPAEDSDEEGNVIVTAKPAIVMEDQLDSLSYVDYDDVVNGGAGKLGKGGLYESIAGSILNLARLKGGSEDLAAVPIVDDSSPDEVLSYTLAKLSEASDAANAAAGANDGDKSSDEWVDLEDDTDDYESSAAFVRSQVLVR